MAFFLPTQTLIKTNSSRSGAYYASTDDLIALADGILSNKLLSPAKTRKWLKPWATTASSGTMVGAPWEIYLARNVTSDQRTVEVYTKNGGLLTYSSYVVLVPDYDLVFTILATGPTAELPYLGTQVILSTLVQALMPALEASSRDEAAPAAAAPDRHRAAVPHQPQEREARELEGRDWGGLGGAARAAGCAAGLGAGVVRHVGLHRQAGVPDAGSGSVHLWARGGRRCGQRRAAFVQGHVEEGGCCGSAKV